MKNLTLFLVVLSILVCKSASANNSCNIPEALKVGVHVQTKAFSGKITEIDKKNCRMRLDEATWINLTAVAGIYIKG